MNRNYEWMVLVDSNWASNAWDEVEGALKGLVEKVGGAIERMERWQDQKLAYPIKIERTVHRRGTYVLAAITLPNDAPAELQREIELDTRMLRALVLKRRDDEIGRIFDEFPDVDARRRAAAQARAQQATGEMPEGEGEAATATATADAGEGENKD